MEYNASGPSGIVDSSKFAGARENRLPRGNATLGSERDGGCKRGRFIL